MEQLVKQKVAFTPSGTEIRKEVVEGPVTIDSIGVSKFQKPKTLTATLRQVITTTSYYPAARASNEAQDNFFTVEEFGFGEQEFVSVENRIAFLLIPETMNAEELLQRITNNPKARIYKVVSNHPILTPDQKSAIVRGQKILDDFADKQVVRYPISDNDNSGKIILDSNGKIQYRKTYSSTIGRQDQDFRTADSDNFYISAAIRAELADASIMFNQGIN